MGPMRMGPVRAKVESLGTHAGSGAQTGMKWLLDETNCLRSPCNHYKAGRKFFDASRSRWLVRRSFAAAYVENLRLVRVEVTGIPVALCGAGPVLLRWGEREGLARTSHHLGDSGSDANEDTPSGALRNAFIKALYPGFERDEGRTVKLKPAPAIR